MVNGGRTQEVFTSVSEQLHPVRKDFGDTKYKGLCVKNFFFCQTGALFLKRHIAVEFLELFNKKITFPFPSRLYRGRSRSL